jgi:hypothetical protein
MARIMEIIGESCYRRETNAGQKGTKGKHCSRTRMGYLRPG